MGSVSRAKMSGALFAFYFAVILIIQNSFYFGLTPKVEQSKKRKL
jgi:hypothetical protein